MLGVIGLRPAEQRVYEVLVESRPRTLVELQCTLGLSVQQLRPVLRSLRAKGLVTRSGPRYGAVAPDVALSVLFLHHEEELRLARGHAAVLQERYRAVVGGNAADLVEVVHGPEAISRRVDLVIRSAHDEVRFVDKPPYARQPSTLHPAERDLLQRGVRFRGIYERSALDLHDLRADVEAGVSLGEEARVLADVPTKMVLADSHLGIMPLRTTPAALESAVVVHPSALLDALGALFTTLWSRAVPLAMTAADALAGLSEEDARLLALLTTGLPDRSIAKQLGLSYRTYQRRLHRLMTVLGAETRFQAGLRAAARGWVSLS